jgi:hypothetical protein
MIRESLGINLILSPLGLLRIWYEDVRNATPTVTVRSHTLAILCRWRSF